MYNIICFYNLSYSTRILFQLFHHIRHGKLYHAAFQNNLQNVTYFEVTNIGFVQMISYIAMKKNTIVATCITEKLCKLMPFLGQWFEYKSSESTDCRKLAH